MSADCVELLDGDGAPALVQGIRVIALAPVIVGLSGGTVADPGAVRGLRCPASSGESEEALVRLEGEIDISCAEWVPGMVTSLLTTGTRSVAIDLSAVTFIDCSGLRVLAQIHALATARSVRCAFVHPSPAVQRVLTLVGSTSAVAPAPGGDGPADAWRRPSHATRSRRRHDARPVTTAQGNRRHHLPSSAGP